MIQKLFTNLGVKAIRVIGWRMMLRMWWGCIIKLPSILRDRNLFSLDRYMSSVQEMTINGHYGRFKIRPAVIDSMIKEESTTFSSIRELYIRDCYFKFHHFDPQEVKTVLDLGANRGLASCMFTPFADKIVSIEAQSDYEKVIRFNVSETNGFLNHHIGCYFIDRQHQNGSMPLNVITIKEVVEKYDLEYIDFLKMDIEGIEFNIFDHLPFSRIKYLSMEVHREFGSPAIIIESLRKNSFSYILATNTLRRTDNIDEVDYIYAVNERLKGQFQPQS